MPTRKNDAVSGAGKSKKFPQLVAVEDHAESLVVVHDREEDGEDHHPEELEEHAVLFTIATTFTP